MPLSAPLLDADGKRTGDVALDEAIFGAELKLHLVHETVRAELAAARRGTRGAKSRGEVSGGRAKPWRQKGTGRARQGTIRAPQFEGGGVAFPPTMRSFELKVNRKARKSALRGALSSHVARSAVGVVDGEAFLEPKTKAAASLVTGWGAERPLLVVCGAEEAGLARSFRNIARVAVVTPAELEVRALAWARSLLVSRAALDDVARLAGDRR
jgi:large subunit ribosomal protein L4